MGQYLHFRSWLNGSSGGEKALAATAVTVVVGLTGWAVFPTGSAGDATVGLSTTEVGQGPGSTDPAAPMGQSLAPVGGAGTAPGAVLGATTGSTSPVGSTSTGGTTTGGIPGSTTGGTTGGTAGGATGVTPQAKCGQLTSTDQGVTPTTIRIAAVTLELAGAVGNSAIGLASKEQQEQMGKAMVAEINSHGGVACRKLAVTFFSANPIDPSTSQQACLDIVQGKFFATIDMGGLTYPIGASDCVARNKIPIFALQAPTPKQQKQFYPYIMSIGGDPVRNQKDAVRGMAQRGWFTAGQGFKKLGVLMDDCSPEVNEGTFQALAQVGIQKSQISIASFSCPSGGFPPPSEMQAAVIQHVRDKVTNVIPVAGGGSFKTYSIAAQRQGFKPKYTTTDYTGMEITSTGDTGPDRDNFDRTVSVTSTRIGQNTSGLRGNSATLACIAIFKRHGLPTEWVMGPSASKFYQGGLHCSAFLTFQAAVNHAPSLTRPNVAVGLTKLGRVPIAFYFGDAVFDSPGKLTGGDNWWVIQFHKSCTCWKVIDPTLRSTFR